MSNNDSDPRRGAGFQAAATAREAALLIAAVARETGSGWSGATGAAAQATALAERCDELAAADAAVFAAALAALAEPSGDLVPRMEAAAEVPVQIAEIAADIAEAAVLVAERCDGMLRADAVAAAALAAGAAAAAAALVRANLLVTPDDPRSVRASRAADDARYAASRALDSGA
jgi:methenyltetrahydrofolate cyclohydrolase